MLKNKPRMRFLYVSSLINIHDFFYFPNFHELHIFMWTFKGESPGSKYNIHYWR